MKEKHIKESILNLKIGDTFYKVNHKNIQKFTFACIHPNNKKYFIFIDRFEDPIRLYIDEVKVLIESNIKDYKGAKTIHIKKLESHLESIKNK